MISYTRGLEPTPPAHVSRARIYALLGEYHLARANGQHIEEFVSVIDARHDLDSHTLSCVVCKLASAVDLALTLNERKHELTQPDRDGITESHLCFFEDAAALIGMEVVV